MEKESKKKLVYFLNIGILLISVLICWAIWRSQSSTLYYLSDDQVVTYRQKQISFEQEILHPYLVIDVQTDSLANKLNSKSIKAEVHRQFPYLLVDRHLVIYVPSSANHFSTTCRNEVIPIFERYKLRDYKLEIADDGSVTIDLKEHLIDGGKFVTLPAVLLSALFE